jgi:hypothetical protein
MFTYIIKSGPAARERKCLPGDNTSYKYINILFEYDSNESVEIIRTAGWNQAVERRYSGNEDPRECRPAEGVPKN